MCDQTKLDAFHSNWKKPWTREIQHYLKVPDQRVGPTKFVQYLEILYQEKT